MAEICVAQIVTRCIRLSCRRCTRWLIYAAPGRGRCVEGCILDYLWIGPRQGYWILGSLRCPLGGISGIGTSKAVALMLVVSQTAYVGWSLNTLSITNDVLSST